MVLDNCIDTITNAGGRLREARTAADSTLRENGPGGVNAQRSAHNARVSVCTCYLGRGAGGDARQAHSISESHQ